MQKQRFWLYQRAGIYYLQDAQTGRRESLNTRSKREAEQTRAARNDAAANPRVGLAMAKAILTTYDPQMARRTWQDVMEEFCRRGKPQTQTDRRRLLARRPFDSIRLKKLIETTNDDFICLLRASGDQAHHNLRCLQNLALGMGWLPWPILPPRLWPSVPHRRKRGVTFPEHQLIVRAEADAEWRHYYELLWETGASQTDAAKLRAENVDWNRCVLSYQRQKTEEWAHLSIGEQLRALLQRLPDSGHWFPHIAKMRSSARAAEFFYHCRSLGINGVSLHSYRYAWAERARACGYPERWAQNALGHDSRAVHQAYAKGGMAVCPSLDEYEKTHSANTTMNAQTGLTLRNQEAPAKPPFHYVFAKVELDNATAARAIRPR